jgi:hypothetical protein
MDLQDRVDRNIATWRMVYQFFSGLLFIALGVVIFIRGKGLVHFLGAGLFGSVLAAYGIYRLIMFGHSLKKRRAERNE